MIVTIGKHSRRAKQSLHDSLRFNKDFLIAAQKKTDYRIAFDIANE